MVRGYLSLFSMFLFWFAGPLFSDSSDGLTPLVAKLDMPSIELGDITAHCDAIPQHHNGNATPYRIYSSFAFDNGASIGFVWVDWSQGQPQPPWKRDWIVTPKIFKVLFPSGVRKTCKAWTFHKPLAYVDCPVEEVDRKKLLSARQLDVRVDADGQAWEKLTIRYPPYYQDKLPGKQRLGVCTVVRNNAPFLREVCFAETPRCA
jgi:hypothetical protein